MTPSEALAAFAERVAADEVLRSRLATITDHANFASVCVVAGHERGFEFTEADVRSLLQARHLFWLQRHIL